MGQYPQLGLTAYQSERVIWKLDYHHAQRSVDPLRTHYLERGHFTENVAGVLGGGVVHGVGAEEAHAAAGERLLHYSVFGFLLDVEVDLTVVDHLCHDRQVAMHDDIFYILSLQYRYFVDLPLALTLLFLKVITLFSSYEIFPQFDKLSIIIQSVYT